MLKHTLKGTKEEEDHPLDWFLKLESGQVMLCCHNKTGQVVKVLMIDDEGTLQRWQSSELKSLGFKVTDANQIKVSF